MGVFPDYCQTLFSLIVQSILRCQWMWYSAVQMKIYWFRKINSYNSVGVVTFPKLLLLFFFFLLISTLTSGHVQKLYNLLKNDNSNSSSSRERRGGGTDKLEFFLWATTHTQMLNCLCEYISSRRNGVQSQECQNSK